LLATKEKEEVRLLPPNGEKKGEKKVFSSFQEEEGKVTEEKARHFLFYDNGKDPPVKGGKAGDG